MSRLVLHTDGACRGNPGPGGWAFRIEDTDRRRFLERCGAEKETTNNRMELLAILRGLQSIKKSGSEILVRSDSNYSIQACRDWMAGWKRNNWKRKGGELKNVDILKKLADELPRHSINWEWVKGHAGDPGNERADTLANEAIDRLLSDDIDEWDQRGSY